MLDNNQWLGLGVIAGIAYLVDNDYRGGKEYSAESFDAEAQDNIEKMIHFLKTGDAKGLSIPWESDNQGQVVIYTGCTMKENGEVIEMTYCEQCGSPEWSDGGCTNEGNCELAMNAESFEAEDKCDRLWDCKTCERCKSHCGCGNDKKLRRTNMRKMYGKNIYNPDTLCGHGAESFDAEYSYYQRHKAFNRFLKNMEESGVFDDGRIDKYEDLCDKYELQGMSEEECMFQALKDMGLYEEMMEDVNVDAFLENYKAESFDAESGKGYKVVLRETADAPYLIRVDMGNEEMKKKGGIGPFGGSAMASMTQQNLKGNFYDEEQARYRSITFQDLAELNEKDRTLFLETYFDSITGRLDEARKILASEEKSGDGV